MLQRFVDRYHLWREEKRSERAGTNPLFWFALVAGLALAHDAYTLATSHQLPWIVLATEPLLIAFLILYFRQSPLAWCFIPLWGAVLLVQLPLTYASSSPRVQAGIWISVLFGVGFIAYGFFVKKRYHSYLEEESSRAIDTSNI